MEDKKKEFWVMTNYLIMWAIVALSTLSMIALNRWDIAAAGFAYAAFMKIK